MTEETVLIGLWCFVIVASLVSATFSALTIRTLRRAERIRRGAA